MVKVKQLLLNSFIQSLFLLVLEYFFLVFVFYWGSPLGPLAPYFLVDYNPLVYLRITFSLLLDYWLVGYLMILSAAILVQFKSKLINFFIIPLHILIIILINHVEFKYVNVLGGEYVGNISILSIVVNLVASVVVFNLILYQTIINLDKLYMKKKLKIVSGVVAAAFFLFVAVLGFRAWQIKTGRIIILENGNWMTRADYLKKYPIEGTIFEDKNTPFDTYNEFYALIQKGDYDKAVLLIDDGDKNRRPRFLNEFKTEGEWLNKWKSKLPERLENNKLKVDGNYASYDWDWGDGIGRTIDFSKNQDGLWKIDNI